MGSCSEIQDSLSLYIDNALSEKEHDRVTRHLSECEACGNELELLRETVAKVKLLPQPELPSGFHKKLMREVPPRRRGFSLPKIPIEKIPIGKYSAIAASLLILFTVMSAMAVGLNGIREEKAYSPYFAPHASAGGGQTPYTGGEPLLLLGDEDESSPASAPVLVNDRLFGTSETMQFDMAQSDTAQREEAQSGTARHQADEQMVKEYHIELITENFDAAMEMIESLPGYNSQSWIVNNEWESRASFERRVDAEDYAMAKVALQSVGKVQTSWESEERITAQRLDLEARLSAKQEEADRLFALLGSSKTIDVLALVESRLGQVENELDDIKAKLRYNADQSDKPRLSITLRGERTILSLDKPSLSVRTSLAFAHSVNGTIRFMESFLLVISYISVPLVIIGILLLLAFLIYRRKRKRREADETD